MKIIRYTFEHRNDFSAIVECEHCGHTGELKYGYHDAFYHNSVLPSIRCGKCGLNRDGTTQAREGVNGLVVV